MTTFLKKNVKLPLWTLNLGEIGNMCATWKRITSLLSLSLSLTNQFSHSISLASPSLISQSLLLSPSSSKLVTTELLAWTHRDGEEDAEEEKNRERHVEGKMDKIKGQ